MAAEVFAAAQWWRAVQIGLAGVERQSIVGEFAGDQHVGGRAFQVNADLRFTVENADEARHRHQFHFQPWIAFEQAVHAAGEEHDAQPLRYPTRILPSGAVDWVISSWASNATFSMASACLSSASPAGVNS